MIIHVPMIESHDHSIKICVRTLIELEKDSSKKPRHRYR